MRQSTLCSLFAASAVAMFGTADEATAQRHDRRVDIVQTAVNAGSFTTLAAALEAAGLVETLKGHGPFTVFAPTDEAFAALPDGTVETLLRPENRDKLIAVLTYHVIDSRVTASRAGRLKTAETLNGQRVEIAVDNGQLQIDESTVVTADVRASNGVIHVIDRVLLPADMNIVATAAEAGTFSTLLAAAEAAGLAGPLSDDGPFTVFAPTDEAFANLPDGTVEGLLAEEGLGTLKKILQYHVVKGRVFADEALSAGRARTLNRERVRFSLSEGRLRVNDAGIVATDIDASNGVIHVIDAVLLPEDIMNSEAPMEPASTEAASMASARTLIGLAIDRGVPLFNSGDARGCAAVYEVAAVSLTSGAYTLPTTAKRDLERAIRDARRTHNQTDRAWALRRGLDRALASMGAMSATGH